MSLKKKSINLKYILILILEIEHTIFVILRIHVYNCHCTTQLLCTILTIYYM